MFVTLFAFGCHTHKNHDHGDHDKKAEETKEVIKEEMDKTDPQPERPEILKLGQEIRITKDNPVTIKSEWMEIRLREVKDSRCPKDVNCIQAGEAEVRLMMVRQGDMASDVRLKAKGNCFETNGSCGNNAKAQGYVFSLVSLTPYPGEDGKQSVDQGKYVATVIVEKAADKGKMKK
ncbi:MAG: hypothetical protein AB8F74_15450 [Saprospiraceae bacterium]